VDEWMNGELVWVRDSGKIQMCAVWQEDGRSAGRRLPKSVSISNVRIPLLTRVPNHSVFRHPIRITEVHGGMFAGPIFAILAGSDASTFVGARMNFRDIMNVARLQGKFVYVLPSNHVREDSWWTGYVRMGYKRWIALPVPQPEAIYNRIPTRMHEGKPDVAVARRLFHTARIPMFNPYYFNKSVIYDALRRADLTHFLPDSRGVLNRTTLFEMSHEHDAIYLKPAGGSVGHGMIRIEKQGAGWDISVLKNSVCKTYKANSFASMTQLVQQHRVRGKYVIQKAIPLLTWQGRPCDFRVLLQKTDRHWYVIGKGVRVSGPNTITTHVPNGGYIASAKNVLERSFGERATVVDSALTTMVTQCAEAIDQFYQGDLGEMSMDIGIDPSGEMWFFEANSKPMKFDEPDIRAKSLQGILNRLEDLRRHRAISEEKS